MTERPGKGAARRRTPRWLRRGYRSVAGGAPDDGAPALAVEDLTVRYKGFTAVSAVHLTVGTGDIVGLIGPNGAGKTSCFNAICGYVRPSEGTVSIHGRRVPFNNPHAAWASGIGRTFQRLELFWTLDVADHLELARRHALKQGRTPPTVDETLALLTLEPVRSRLVAELPQGTCRLVELGRAICTGADVILLDEPCSGLDRRETQGLERALRLIHGRLGLSLLIVEHDMEFILSIAQRVSVMNYGQVIAEGTPAEIRSSPEVRLAYLGDPAAAG